MDVLTFCAITWVLMIISFYIGRHFSTDKIASVIEHNLDNLEKDGYIITKRDKNGERDLVLVSSVVADALREYKSS